MNIAISGITGLIGRELASRLAAAGHAITGIGRRAEAGAAYPQLAWPAEGAAFQPETLAPFDAIVNLAGETINGRWTKTKMQRIRESRLSTTRAVAVPFGQLAADEPSRSRTFIGASAVGFYGKRGTEVVTEDAGPGSGFLPEVAQQWEAAARLAAPARVVHARFGVVLTPKGGALQQMLLPFKLGVGGRLGSGQQLMSWVTLHDATSALLWALDHEEAAGAINVCAPHPATNAEFTRALGQAVGRPTMLPVPAFALRLAFGSMADDVLLASIGARPEVLQKAGFQFSQPEIGAALRELASGRPQN